MICLSLSSLSSVLGPALGPTPPENARGIRSRVCSIASRRKILFDRAPRRGARSRSDDDGLSQEEPVLPTGQPSTGAPSSEIWAPPQSQIRRYICADGTRYVELPPSLRCLPVESRTSPVRLPTLAAVLSPSEIALTTRLARGLAIRRPMSAPRSCCAPAMMPT